MPKAVKLWVGFVAASGSDLEERRMREAEPR
jgi:hypothetical protein